MKKSVKIEVKDKIIEIEDVSFIAFERNFVSVTHKKGKDYFKVASVLSIEERGNATN